MTSFEKITAEEVAVQHQLLIDLLLHTASLGNAELRDDFARSIDKMSVGLSEKGLDTSLLDDASANLRQQNNKS